MDRLSWKKILSRIFIDQIPNEFIEKIIITLVDGTTISVDSEEELIDVIEKLRFESNHDPITSIDYSLDYVKIKKLVKTQIDELMNPIMKGPNNDKTE